MCGNSEYMEALPLIYALFWWVVILNLLKELVKVGMKSSPFNITVIACDVNNGESTSIYGLGEKQQDFMTSPLQDSNTDQFLGVVPGENWCCWSWLPILTCFNFEKCVHILTVLSCSCLLASLARSPCLNPDTVPTSFQLKPPKHVGIKTPSGNFLRNPNMDLCISRSLLQTPLWAVFAQAGSWLQSFMDCDTVKSMNLTFPSENIFVE